MSMVVGRRIERIEESGGITARHVAQLLATTPQNVLRWRNGRATPGPDSLRRLRRLERLTDQLGRVYTPDEARLWLFSPHADMGGERPADLIRGDRMDEVLAILDQLRSVAYI